MLARTWRFRVINPSAIDNLRAAKRAFIFSLWHGQLLPLLWHHREEGVVLLISEHQDGEMVARAAESLGIPVVSGNVSLYNETGGSAIPPTPVIGCVGLVRDVTAIPDRWRSGDRIVLLRGFGHGLVHFMWRHAHLFSLAHDVSDGGVALALREAEAWSGRAADAEIVEGEGVIVAADPATEIPWDDIVELGTVA